MRLLLETIFRITGETMIEQKTGIRPKVGDVVYIVGSRDSGLKTVTSVGKKYFYIEKSHSWHRDIRFDIGCKNGTMADGDAYGSTRSVYESEQCYFDELENQNATKELQQLVFSGSSWFRYQPPQNVTASDIRRAIAILKGEA